MRPLQFLLVREYKNSPKLIVLRKALMSRFSQKFILVRRRRRMKSPIWQTITWPLMSSDEHCKARRGSWWEERALAKVRSFFAFETRFHLDRKSTRLNSSH